MNKLTERRDVNPYFLVYSYLFYQLYNAYQLTEQLSLKLKTNGNYKYTSFACAFRQFITLRICGQIISGYFGDRIQPEETDRIGPALSFSDESIASFLCKRHADGGRLVQSTVLRRRFCGLLLMKEMTSCCSRRFASEQPRVSWGQLPVSNFFTYLISPIVISLLNWKYVFFHSGCCGIG